MPRVSRDEALSDREQPEEALQMEGLSKTESTASPKKKRHSMTEAGIPNEVAHDDGDKLINLESAAGSVSKPDSNVDDVMK